MKNAHLRLARLRYELLGEKRRTSISVCLDRLVAEVDQTVPSLAQAHLLSVVGTDAEIAAISAALSTDAFFMLDGPGITPVRVSLKAKPQCYKGTIALRGRNRSLRHLIVLSGQWTISANSANPPQIFLLDASPEFVWTNVAYIYGLPARPDWASWFHQRLVAEGSIVPLVGVGCDPVLINGERDRFLSWLGEGVATRALEFPAENGPILWPNITLGDLLIPPSEQEPAGPRPAA
jgi:hypothetical protein